MARLGGKKPVSFLVKRGLVVSILGFYSLIIYGAHGAEHEEEGEVSGPISRIVLTLETPDGRRYAYRPSPSLTALSVEQPPAPEGWLQSFSRNLAVGVTIPLVLLGVSEVFSWVKQRYRYRAMKEQARNRARERRRLLRNIYAVQEELQDLEDESQEMKDELGNSREDKAARAWRKARKQDLKFTLDDLRYQLRDMYEYSSSDFERTTAFYGSSEATSGAYWSQDDSTRLGRTTRTRHSPQRPLENIGNAMGAAHFGGAGRGTKHPASSTVDSAVVAKELLRGKEVLQQDKRVADKRHQGRRRRLNRLTKQSRMEIVRQLVDEVPGMPPQEVLRMAENVSTRGV